MKQNIECPFNIFVPNLLNICVDAMEYEEIGGRIYHCYNKEPIIFRNVLELVQEAEKFFDSISFPQASTKARTFTKREEVQCSKLDKVVDQPEVFGHSGEKGSFITSVRFRQNATWQGEFYCKETKCAEAFSDVMEFIKKIDREIKRD